jgi:hypothetical protein
LPLLFVRLGFLIAIAFHTLIFMLSLAVLDWKFALSYMATTVATFVLGLKPGKAWLQTV